MARKSARVCSAVSSSIFERAKAHVDDGVVADLDLGHVVEADLF